MVYLFTRTHGRVQKDTFAQPRTLHLCNCAYGPQLVNTPTMGVAPDAYLSRSLNGLLPGLIIE